MIRQTHKDIDKVIEWLQDTTGKLTLTKRQQTAYDKAFIADDLIRKYKTNAKVLPVLRKMVEDRWGKPIGDLTARRIMQDAKTIFGTTHKSDKEYDKQFFVEWCKEEALKASTAGDLRAFASIMGNIIKLGAYDKVLPDVPNFAQLAPHVNLYVADPKLLGVKPIENLDKVVTHFLQKKRALKVPFDSEAQIVEDGEA